MLKSHVSVFVRFDIIPQPIISDYNIIRKSIYLHHNKSLVFHVSFMVVRSGYPRLL